MNEIIVINKHKAKNIISQRHVYIGRPSGLGNPFAINEITDRIDVINAFVPYLDRKITEGHIVVCAELERIAAMVLDDTGLPVYLVCFCAPLPCHGDKIKAKVLEVIAANQG